jgi:hypothetical protein
MAMGLDREGTGRVNFVDSVFVSFELRPDLDLFTRNFLVINLTTGFMKLL